MTDWQRKLTSRKLWMSIAGFIAGLFVMFGGSEENADKLAGAILGGASVVGYVFGEGLADSGNAAGSDINGNDKNDKEE